MAATAPSSTPNSWRSSGHLDTSTDQHACTATARLRDRNGAAALGYLAVYATLFALFAFFGPGMQLSFHYSQLLPEAALRERLWESIFYLHGQPPLLNTAIGLLLWLEQATTIPPRTALTFLDFIVGGVIVYCQAELARTLLPTRWTRVVMALLLLHPYFYLTLFDGFYTIHELLLLSVFAFLALGYWRDPRSARLVAALVALAALALTRALYHPLFCLVLAGLVVFPVSPGSGGTSKLRHALVGIPRQAGQEELLERGREAGTDLARRLRLRLQDRDANLGERLAGERQLARERVIEDRPERKDVGAHVEIITQDLIG